LQSEQPEDQKEEEDEKQEKEDQLDKAVLDEFTENMLAGGSLYNLYFEFVQ
jgi:hypothetical protein